MHSVGTGADTFAAAAGRTLLCATVGRLASTLIVRQCGHCFVDGQASLLVEWRRGPTGWEVRVISVVWIDAVGWATIERWLPAAALSG